MPNRYIFDKTIFSKRLREAREKKDYKRNELSELLEININTLARWESPQSKLMPGYPNLIALLNELDLDPAFLFSEDGIKIDSQKNNQIYSIIENLTEKEKNIILTLIISLVENRQGETIG